MSLFVVSSSIIFFLLQTVNGYVDFYIKQWLTSTDKMSPNNSNSVIGYSSNSSIFYLLGGFQFVTQQEEYIYDVNSGIFKLNATLTPGDYISNYYTLQQFTTFNAINGSSYIYIYFSSSYSDFIYNHDSQNFYIFDMENNILNKIGNLYPKPQSMQYQCLVNDNKQYIYLIGGAIWNDTFQSYVSTKYFMKFDVHKYEWIIDVSLNIKRQKAGCIYVENRLFVFGGNDEQLQHSIEMLYFSLLLRHKWIIINNTINNINFIAPTALYPYKNVLNNDNWISSTIFLFSTGCCASERGFSCYKFNYRTYDIVECNYLPNKYVEYPTIIYAYTQNQYRLYLFGGLDTSTNIPPYDPVSTIQYALLDFN